ncbi:MAG: 50S ribosome-binding GTPase [Phycisphaerae bacterium]|nr:50S ribosome-binding GTPase [Phycisphaerae bacterium]
MSSQQEPQARSAFAIARLGLDVSCYDKVVALAGNPNTGKSTVFNTLTGLRQHTGNWPGKTVSRAEGGFVHRDVRYKLVDLPGTYSLLSASQDEEVARDFLLFGRPDCTIVVADATVLERNLNLVFQVMEITDKVVVCVNLMDEAARKGLSVDGGRLALDLGVPVVLATARTGGGLPELLEAVSGVVAGEIVPTPRCPPPPEGLREAVEELLPLIKSVVPGVPNPRWVAYRLLEGDHSVRQALLDNQLQRVVSEQARPVERKSRKVALEGGQ